jgi:hypothetical protein
METKYLLQYSQEPTDGLSSEPDQPNSYAIVDFS